MSRKFYKHKLLLDENMPPRTYFRRLNHLFDVKHIALDFKISSLSDELVYQEAILLKRILVTFNGNDFRELSQTSALSGVISVSRNLPNEQIDKKLVSLLIN